MKHNEKCVKCGCRRLLVIDEVREQHEFLMGTTFHVYNGQNKQGGSGKFQVFVCLQCGYTEWYAYDLEKLLQKLPADARIIDGNLSTGPYR